MGALDTANAPNETPLNTLEVRAFRVDTDIDDPVLIAPPQGATLGTQKPEFRWTHDDPSQPITYTIQIAVSGDIETGPYLINRNDLTAKSFTPSTDLPVDPVTLTRDYAWRVRARDDAGNVSNFVDRTLTVNRNQPRAPLLVSPIAETGDLDTTFIWQPQDALSNLYDLEITSGDFSNDALITTAIRDIPHAGISGSRQTRTLSELPALGIPVPTLEPGRHYRWRVRGKTRPGNDPLTGLPSTPAAFVTTGAQVGLTLEVLLEGTGDAPVDFKVVLYDAKAFRNIDQTRWLLFTDPARGQHARRTVAFKGKTGTPDAGTGKTLSGLPLGDVTTGYYDITVEADGTLVNLRDDVPLAGPVSLMVDIGILPAGNALNDTRVQKGQRLEPASIVNSLDASVLVAAFGTSKTDTGPVLVQGDLKAFDPRADFDRDGDVDDADFALLDKYYLLFSPVVVLGAVDRTGDLATGDMAITPPSGMVSWWPGDGNADDIIGSNDGALTGDATFATGMVGQGFSLSGSGDVFVAPSPSLNLTGDLTVDLWARRTVFGGGGVMVLKATGDVTYELSFTGDQLAAGFSTGGAFFGLLGPSVLDSNFHHYAYVRSGNSHKLFMDGAVVASLSFAGTAPDSSGPPVIIGVEFAGVLDEVEIFNRALSDAEVKSIYDAGSAGKLKPS